jgi:CRISPR/Cas system Type II protein with McrA/HNH and RuvC-like nuclease domain
MPRKSFNKKERTRLFSLYEGRCYLCEGKIDANVEAWDIEHVIPWEISRDDSDENLRLAHRKNCHTKKTAKDRKDISKVQRMAAKHNGTWVRKGPKLRSRGFS